MILCPICEQGYVTEKNGKNKVIWNGVSEEIDCEYSICDFCLSEVANSEQMKRNKERMQEFKRRVENEYS